MAKIHIIIVAAGSGLRFGAPLPKQFLPLRGLPVVMHTINAFRNSLADFSETLVISPGENDRWEALCKEYDFTSPQTVFGGSTRFESVRNALSHVPEEAEIVMVHDGARPFPSPAMLQRIEREFGRPSVQGVIPAVPVTDSLRKLTVDGMSKAVDRSCYVAVQTPQAFRKSLLIDAYARANSDRGFTDDASVMEAAGYDSLIIVEGDSQNIKITNPGDIEIASAILDK